ncbi:MAG: hypothetical protein WBG92_04335 [Thiohalocapsa sp.]
MNRIEVSREVQFVTNGVLPTPVLPETGLTPNAAFISDHPSPRTATGQCLVHRVLIKRHRTE